MAGSSRGRTALVAFLAAAAAALVLLPLLGLFRDSGDAPPAEGSADVGFARDMAVHHAQAVDMSFLVREGDPADDVAVLAYDIINTQSTQRGMMMGWLDVWGLPQTSSAPPMAWAGEHGHDAGDGMPGLATREELDALAALADAGGTAAEVQYLTLMVRHHRGGVAMAEAALAAAQQPVVRRLAETVVATQEAEIQVMNDLLAERGAPPV
jgi:uncharacterized protein (DUF305 family)